MSVELKVPTVGESITEVQIGEWLKKEGDAVKQDETVVMIETDKVTVELVSPAAGVLSKIVAKTGTTLSVGDVVGLVEAGAAAVAKPAAPASTEAPKPAAAPKVEEAPRSEGPPRSSVPPEGFARVMPSAKRLLDERGLSAAEVEATGPGGRLLKEDVLRHDSRPAPPSSPPAPVGNGAREEEVVAMTPMRKRIAERLVESQSTAALLTTFNEVDMSAAMELRKTYQEAFQTKYGVKLGFMSFFVKAAIEALKLIPAVNAEIRGTNIVYKNYYDIGVAVGGGKGLVVPIIRDADRLSFADVETRIGEFGKRAKDNKLTLDELTGGTFTISNGGIYGSMMSTPIVNPPQSGILGLHAIQDRPVARDGQVVIRPMMYVALTYDHRLVDGREAVTFLKRIKECVENPTRILLEV
jgi:2-oxoglutarate dehydrogenase E2 component (dihydrolipoamide succinyltransferase)